MDSKEIIDQKMILKIYIQKQMTIRHLIYIITSEYYICPEIILYRHKKLSGLERIIKKFADENIIFLNENKVIDYCLKQKQKDIDYYLAVFLLNSMRNKNTKVCIDIVEYIKKHKLYNLRDIILESLEYKSLIQIVPENLKQKIIENFIF